MPGVIRVTRAHTADLEPAVLDQARALLDQAFAGTFSDHDWEHSLGGLHALAWDEHEQLTGHASVVQRRMVHQGRALRCGYVEGVAVAAGRRRQGVGAALLVSLEQVIRRAYDFGGLAASEDGARLYARRGWLPWTGSAWALTPSGRRRTRDEDGWIYVLPGVVPLDPTGELTCDWRDGDLW